MDASNPPKRTTLTGAAYRAQVIQFTFSRAVAGPTPFSAAVDDRDVARLVTTAVAPTATATRIAAAIAVRCRRHARCIR